MTSYLPSFVTSSKMKNSGKFKSFHNVLGQFGWPNNKALVWPAFYLACFWILHGCLQHATKPNILNTGSSYPRLKRQAFKKQDCLPLPPLPQTAWLNHMVVSEL